MRKRMYRLTNSLYTRPETGSIATPTASFSSGFVADAENGYAEISDDEVIATAFQILATKLIRSDRSAASNVTRQYLVARFAKLEHEVFCCIYLNCRHQIIDCEELFRGTYHTAIVHAREVVKQALKHNAAAMIVAHNHPSGSSEESDADRSITRRLKSALELVDVKLLDHLVIAGAVVTSMADKGLL